MNNQECKVRPKIVDISSNNPIFYPFSVKLNRCSGDCNSIRPLLVESSVIVQRAHL